MPASVGYMTAALQLGISTIVVTPKRSIGQFTAQVTIEERHVDELEIVDHPVELGAPISDHSFRRPAALTLTTGWSNSPGSSSLLGSLASAVTGTIGGISSLLSGNSVSQIKETYDNFQKLQNTRIPFEVNTGKRLYKNMLITSLATTTDAKSENILVLKIELRQVLIVTTQTLTVGAPAEDQATPSVTQAPVSAGVKQLTPASTFNAGAGRGAINPASVTP